MATSIPTLTTARLILRPHRREDFDACAALWADPLVTRFIQGRPQTREEVWARLLRYAGHWAWLGHGYWAVEEGGRFIGELGLADFQRQMQPPLGVPELGWALSPAVHGRGYATEALQAVLTWADANLDAAETACIVAPENLVSLRVAEKLGYRQTARTLYKGEDTLVFRRSRRRSGSPGGRSPRR
jgi:RimJ/RimL family protein N-acetyltransferase